MAYEEGIRTTLYFDKQVLDTLDAIAEAQSRSRSNMANLILRDALRLIPDMDEQDEKGKK